MKKAPIISVFLGTIIEVYDFTVFPFLIPVLADVFSHEYSGRESINFTVLAYIVSYLIKPIGAISCGYLIDQFGQKRVMLYATLLMTIATLLIGLMPTHWLCTSYGSVLIVCRIMQGLSISGEFSSAMIFAVEHGKKTPALLGSLAFVGGCIGIVFANLAAFILLYMVPHEQIIQFAWRIPFLFGALGCLAVLFIINSIQEEGKVQGSSALTYRSLVKTHKRKLTEAFLISSLSASAFYITFVFLPTLLTSLLNVHSHKDSILITLLTLVVYLLLLPFGGMLADRIGIRRQIKIASVLYLLFSYAVFALLPQLSVTSCIATLTLFSITQALLNSALPAFLVVQFPKEQRGKALAVSYNVSLALFAGLMPYFLLSSNNQFNPGIPITICAVLSLLIINHERKSYGYLRSKFGYRF
ncbi:MFS transporter [Legionella sp. 16cNR16C]|uniref:MFS transporter n=1 Tax=Legionella sp. 16cNR16C TaxID=2905656 RepID=UPI001E3A6C8C|nr:MFS transporter [Legionella sp. 16cNR16C]MCE3043960.1 MFS transporter [Legionella sp. 16cNR16C]